MSLAAIGYVLYSYLPAIGIFIFILAILSGIARVILGYHDEIDVIAGWATGILAAIITLQFIVPVVFTRFWDSAKMHKKASRSGGMADALDSKSCAERHEGSTPSSGTTASPDRVGIRSVSILSNWELKNFK